jgi:hypothetical protein
MVGAGALVLAGGGVASAQSGNMSPSCQKLTATLSTLQSQLTAAASNPSKLKSAVSKVAAEMQAESASASPAVKAAVGTFLAQLQQAASGQVNIPALTTDAGNITKACTTSSVSAVPTGAPATGGGSTAGLQDAGLFGVGGAALLGGAGALALAWRRRGQTA